MKKFSIAGVLFLLSVLMAATCAAASGTQDGWSEEVLRLSPVVRTSALPPVTAADISFRPQAPSTTPMIADAGMLEHAPRIVATPQGRMLLGKNDIVYVQGALQETVEFGVWRSGARLRDPVSNEYLGDEVRYLGAARLQRLATAVDGLHAFVIKDAQSEITVGDRLLKRLQPTSAPREKRAPQHPSTPVDAAIMSIPDGTENAAQNQLVSINKGARDSVQPGAVLTLYATGSTLHEKTTRQLSGLPEESGRLLILRVFDRVSYGLITQATEPVQVGDKVRAPY